jgi:hypothetical protein
MLTRFAIRISLCLLVCCGISVIAAAAIRQTFSITEPFSLCWGPDRVNYPVEFPQGQVVPQGITLTDAAGNPVAAQLSDITYWPDHRTVRRAVLSFMVTLQPDEQARWTLTAGRTSVRQPKTDLQLVERAGVIELTTAATGIRLPGGTRTFTTPVTAEQLPAPIQGVRLTGGRWIGKGWWQTDRPCLGYTATVVERGPVFARVRLRYLFTDNTAYTAVVELSAQQDVAVISEAFDLAKGKRYAMPELPGTKPGDTFQLVPPHFTTDTERMVWDWWGGTNGKVPSPNCYYFSYYDGLQPDHYEFYGNHNRDSLTGKPLAFTKNDRFHSLNAFYNWGLEEGYYFGAYNATSPTDQVAVIGLLPSRWLHPDLDPHPISTLNQWTQTNDVWIETRTTPDLQLRVPTGLGKRVYGLGVVPHTEPGLLAGGKTVTTAMMLRHIRLGRQPLDQVKDWVLDYPEPGAYPRLLVDPGEMARLRTRAIGNQLPPDNGYISYLQHSTPEEGRKLVAQAIDELRSMCQVVATHNWDHNGYASNMGRPSLLADVALGVPECTSAQAALIRRYVAAIAYNCLSDDYVPPRENGFGWGSANMMNQLRCRGAVMMTSLLPLHPQAQAWREYLARYVVANATSQINEAGATLEIGGYGVMGIEFATVPFLALQHADPQLDTSPFLPILRAAARNHLAYLLPYDLRGNFRPPATIGDSPYVPDYSLAMLAAALEKPDPQLAAELRWGVKAGGLAMHGWSTAQPGMLLDPNPRIEVPAMRSQHFAGSGIILRNGFPSRDETYIALQGGGFAVGHSHSDRGSFILYAKGAPLMVDFASQYSPSIGAAVFHNGSLTFNHDETVRPCPGRDTPGCYFTGKPWEAHTLEPFTCLEPAWDPTAKTIEEAMGTVTSFVSQPSADYGVLTRRINYLYRTPYLLEATHKQFLGRGPTEEVWLKTPFTWTRQALFVKSPEVTGSNYLVLRDDLSGNTELTPAVNYWALAAQLNVTGNLATYTGDFGVDLDVYVADPTVLAATTARAGHTNGREFTDYYRQTFGKPFTEYQTLLRVPQQPGGGFFTVLVPRKHGETAPTFETVLNGKAVRVTFPDGRVDTVVLQTHPTPVTVEGKTLTGAALLVTRRGETVTVTVLSGK